MATRTASGQTALPPSPNRRGCCWRRFQHINRQVITKSHLQSSSGVSVEPWGRPRQWNSDGYVRAHEYPDARHVWTGHTHQSCGEGQFDNLPSSLLSFCARRGGRKNFRRHGIISPLSLLSSLPSRAGIHRDCALSRLQFSGGKGTSGRRQPCLPLARQQPPVRFPATCRKPTTTRSSGRPGCGRYTISGRPSHRLREGHQQQRQRNGSMRTGWICERCLPGDSAMSTAF